MSFQIHHPKGFKIIEIQGKDSRDFLNRLSTADLVSMQDEQCFEACFLNPLGKIISYFWLYQNSPTHYTALIDCGSSSQDERFLAFIDQYHFGEDLKVSEIKPTLTWTFGNANSVKSKLCFDHEDHYFGVRWKTHLNVDSSTLSQAKEISIDEIEKWRINNNSPRVDFEITENTNPLELGLLDSVARQKGCYPGQEVLEKIISLGAPAKRLVQIEFELSNQEVPEDLNSAIFFEDKKIGHLTSSYIQNTPKNTLWITLAIINKNYALKDQTLSIQNKNSTINGMVKQVSRTPID